MGFSELAVSWSLLVLTLLVSHVAQALISEGSSLIQFKSSLVDVRGYLDDWGSAGSEDPCDPFPWTGVTCSNDTENGLTVTELHLQSQFLSGSISSELAGLTNLTRLLLSGNSLSGQIPSSLIDFQQLVELDLGDNVLTGSIPPLPPQVRWLSVGNNFLDGDIGPTNLSNLQTLFTLDLHGNRFTGRLPDMDRPPFTSLERLDVSNNRLDGLLPSGLQNLNLSYCNMSANEFEGEIPDGRWDMTIVDLSRNELRGSIPSQLLMGSSRLTYLNCSGNALSGGIEFNLSDDQPSRLKFLDLSNNKLSGDLQSVLKTAESLEYLCLQDNGFSFGVDRILQGNFSNLRELRLGGNSFVSMELSSASFNFPLLQVMDLRGRIAPAGYTWAFLLGNIPSELFRVEKLPVLRVLDLSYNGLNGTIPLSLSQMPNLRELRLARNSLEGDIYVDSSSSSWTRLEVLDLSSNYLIYTGTQLQAILENFSNLREFRLGASNDYSSPVALPTRVGNLPQLEVLDFKYCYLLGNISGEYTRNDLLPSLKVFNLVGNRLQGSLPEGFGEMPQLIYLNVSYNKLSGKLPNFRYRLFYRSSFMVNEGLCGPPLEDCNPISRTPTLKIWVILLIVVACVLVSGGSCLLFGWIWRRRIDAEVHQQDAELIATLLDRDTTSLMSLRELRTATDDFSDTNQIGMGGFGTVYRGILDDGTEVAIKKSKRDGSSSEEKRQFLNEVRILSQVHHRHLVQLLGCCLANKNALLVFEFVRNGTLEEHLKKGRGEGPLTWEKRLQIAVQTSGALDYLHSSANPPIYHLDVKSANILLDGQLNAKVADFGISKLAPALDATHITTLHGFQGTFGYMDPESIVSSTLTGKSDVYAFGVVLLELITAKAVVDRSRGKDASLVNWAVPLIQRSELGEIIDQTLVETFSTPLGRDSIMDVARLAERCLKFQSALRPSMKDAFKDLLTIQQQFATTEAKNVHQSTREAAEISAAPSFSSDSLDNAGFSSHSFDATESILFEER